MVKGETIMAVPEGIITTSDILVPEVLEEAIAAADAEEATEEYSIEEENDQA
jgi:hypothetical protein